MNFQKPDHNLGVGSGTHGYQTGEIIKRVEEILLKEKPNVVIIPGDTNTTIGAALAAVKLNILTAHLESGLRSYDRTMPEEINRILTDHCSDLLFCPTQLAVENLTKEGIKKGVHKVGDTMYELACLVLEKVKKTALSFSLPKKYILSTIHRAENTTKDRLEKIMAGIAALDLPVIIPLHPRTRKKMIELGIFEKYNQKLTIIEPVGFFAFTKLLLNSQAVITDSGGVQKEAYWHKKPCVTVRDNTEWLETIYAGGNILAQPDEIITKTKQMLSKNIAFDEDLYGYPDTSKRIIAIIEQQFEK
jgi:UDP-N-acetylglucosamine 2-epimerase (non-hydrolysing)